MSESYHLDPDDDVFRPPAISTEVFCLHCRREYQSYLIQWVQERIEGKLMGFWCCPTPGCDGKGFGFDIFPCDPEYRDENGELMWSGDDDDDEAEGDDEDLSENYMPLLDEDDLPPPIDSTGRDIPAPHPPLPLDDEEDIPW